MKSREHYIKLFAHYPDVVTLNDFQKMLGGIGDSTARKLMRENRVYHFYIRCTYLNGTYASVTQYDGTTGYAMKITGGPEKGDASAAQTINVNLPGTETYVLSGWAKADSVPLNDPYRRSFQITAIFTYSDGTEDYAQNLGY